MSKVPAAQPNPELLLREYVALNERLQRLRATHPELEGFACATDPGCFSCLDDHRKPQVIAKLEFLVEMLESSARSLTDYPNHFYLRSALKKFGWKAGPDLFDRLGPRDTIEIYGRDHSLKIANMRFLQVCTYSLPDVMGHTFFELYDRDPSITDTLLATAAKMFDGKLGISEDVGPTHVVVEKFSPRRRRFQVEPKFLAPIYSRWKSIEALVYSATVTVLDET